MNRIVHCVFIVCILLLAGWSCWSYRPLRIITYNVNQEISWEEKRELICRLLHEIDADIICLQELLKKEEAAALAYCIGMYWTEYAWHRGGMTIFSKRAIKKSIVKEIPASYYNAFVTVQLDPDLWIVSIHLSSEYYKQDETERERELMFILHELEKLQATNIIIAGDFNADDTTSIPIIMERAGYHDSHKNKWWQRGTWMPGSNKERIDRIYTKGNFLVLDGQVVDHHSVDWLLDWPTGNDHRLIMTELLLL